MKQRLELKPAPQKGAAMPGADGTEQVLWRRLGNSETARQFQMAFSVATGLPITLVPALATGSCHGTTRRGAFCIEGCMGRQSGKPCLHMLEKAEQRANKGCEPVQFTCPAGLFKILVPVLVGGKHIGNLVAGPFSLEQLDAAKLARITDHLRKFDLEGQTDRLQVSWQHSPVITKEKVEAVLTLIGMFADHLTQAANHLISSTSSAPSTLLEKVDAYLKEMENEEVSLSEVAKRVAVSPCHFCKLFKKQTGLTFSEYRVQRRIDKAKQLLLDPSLRISEAAFQAGFESLPYFNRAFRRYMRCSPSEYRARKGLHKAGQ
jgi:AraC-like DNA-binding protein/ligand-binding sensor protein